MGYELSKVLNAFRRARSRQRYSDALKAVPGFLLSDLGAENEQSQRAERRAAQRMAGQGHSSTAQMHMGMF
jgi:hypothetical protein